MSIGNKKWNVNGGEPTSLPAAPCRGVIEDQLERLKEELLAPLVSSVTNAALVRELEWAANEAAALAWQTACPVLVLPALMDEKARTRRQRWERQQALWTRRNPPFTRTIEEASASVFSRPARAMTADSHHSRRGLQDLLTTRPAAGLT